MTATWPSARCVLPICSVSLVAAQALGQLATSTPTRAAIGLHALLDGVLSNWLLDPGACLRSGDNRHACAAGVPDRVGRWCCASGLGQAHAHLQQGAYAAFGSLR